MPIILSQHIDKPSDYDDVPFQIYHYPKRYRNQIKIGDSFIYYQGDRHKKKNRYYYGCGIISGISPSTDSDSYYATISNSIRFNPIVPIYHPDGGFFESKGYNEVRNRINPAWQNAIRKVSKKAFDEILTHAGLSNRLFLDLVEVHHLLSEENIPKIKPILSNFNEIEIERLLEEDYSEDDLLSVLNNLNSKAHLLEKKAIVKRRVANQKVTKTLKKLYNNSCQLCGVNHRNTYGADVIEAHHIEYFSLSQNHEPSNIIILCPNHHRLIHCAKATFDRNEKVFIYDNGHKEALLYNKHL